MSVHKLPDVWDSVQHLEWTETPPHSFSMSCYSTSLLGAMLGKDLDSFPAVSCLWRVPAPGMAVFFYTGFITAFRSKGFQFLERKDWIKMFLSCPKKSRPRKLASKLASIDGSRSPLPPCLSVWMCSWMGDLVRGRGGGELRYPDPEFPG